MSVVHTMTVELSGNGRQKSLCRLNSYLHARSGQIYVLGMHDTTENSSADMPTTRVAFEHTTAHDRRKERENNFVLAKVKGVMAILTSSSFDLI